MKDQAGNVGKPKTVTVTVSDRPLVERTETLVVPPTGSWSASQLDAVSARAGGNDPVPVPCGVVVPSEVYPEPGASSFRSADTCSG